MWRLWELFDDVVDIATAPVKLTTKAVDYITDLDLTDYVDDLKENIKDLKE